MDEAKHCTLGAASFPWDFKMIHIPDALLVHYFVCRYHTCNLPRALCWTVAFYWLHSQNTSFSSETSPPPTLLLPPSPDVLISSNSYAGQIPGLMMDNLPKVGTAHRHAASLWMPYGQKQLFSLLSLAQMCQTGCRLQSAVLLALGGGCFLLAWQLITLM